MRAACAPLAHSACARPAQGRACTVASPSPHSQNSIRILKKASAGGAAAPLVLLLAGGGASAARRQVAPSDRGGVLHGQREAHVPRTLVRAPGCACVRACVRARLALRTFGPPAYAAAPMRRVLFADRSRRKSTISRAAAGFRQRTLKTIFLLAWCARARVGMHVRARALIGRSRRE